MLQLVSMNMNQETLVLFQNIAYSFQKFNINTASHRSSYLKNYPTYDIPNLQQFNSSVDKH